MLEIANLQIDNDITPQQPIVENQIHFITA